MRLVVTLLVRDEIDVVAATVEHHLAAGADLLVVTDNGSTDGTVEVLRRYVRAGVVDLLHEPEQDYAQSRWVTRMARRAATEHHADWVLHADADEFWRPADGGWDLRPVLEGVPPDTGVVRARRLNLVAARGAVGPWPDRLVLRDALSLSERGTPLGPKVGHRATQDVVVAQGNHAVEGSGLTAALDGLLQILHVPARSYEQYARKIRNGGDSLERSRLPPEMGWHWRAEHRRLREGTLELAYHSRLPVGADGQQHTEDLALRDRLRTLVSDAVLPADLHRVLRGGGAG